MKRPSSRASTMALVGVSIATGGAALVSGGPAALVNPSNVLSLTCVTAVAVSIVRRAVLRSEERARATLDKFARQQDLREQQLMEREEALRRRERLVDQTLATTDLRIRSAYARVDQVLDERTKDRVRYAELRTEYQELVREYNALVLEAAANPTRHPLAVGQTSPLPVVRGPRRIQRRGPHPQLEVVDDHHTSA
ncbi:hypothetical protein GCM10010250_21200 [Streptomyces althioticus]|uniref:hypothetical protein n=1 Tax=Streptomyces althioticus TaxID=83380 RepID=UPI0018771AC8|nr:hypothetical protein GCM10010250_21200 [Streptomyces althioticus]